MGLLGAACFAGVPVLYGCYAVWCIRLRRTCTCPSCSN